MIITTASPRGRQVPTTETCCAVALQSQATQIIAPVADARSGKIVPNTLTIYPHRFIGVHNDAGQGSCNMQRV